MDTRLLKAAEDMEKNVLTLDDTFRFKCRACGRCCKNRHDIMLTTRDVYNIARSLGRTMQYVVERYCDAYIGEASRIPIVRLMPTGPEQTCPLMRNKRCIVHKAKPVVCALYPLGRGTKMNAPGNGEEAPGSLTPIYFLQSHVCGTQEQTHTVRGWLEHFGIPVEDEFYGIWTERITKLATSFHRLEAKKLSAGIMEQLWNLAFSVLYLQYDMDKAILPQFQENTKKLLNTLAKRAEEGF